MEKFLFTLIFIYSINPIFPTTHFAKSERYLHVYQDENQSNKPLVIKNTDSDLAEVISQRFRRDLTSTDRNENVKNITTKVTKTQTTFFSFPYHRNFNRKWGEKAYASFQLIISALLIHLKITNPFSTFLGFKDRKKDKKERWCMGLVFVLLADGS